MPKSRKKRNEKKDFQKVKLKVGKTLKKADNVTNPSFHTRTIQVTQKIKSHSATEPSSKRKLNFNDLLNQFHHYSVSTRNDAVMGMRELFLSYPDIIVPNLAAIVERTAQLFVDKDPVVRSSVIKLLKIVFTPLAVKHISPFFRVISAHLCCAMTHIDEGIQVDSLHLLDLLLDHFPTLVVSNSSQILPNFIEQISRCKLSTKSGSSSLSINPHLKMASHKWRAKVLTRLYKLLSAILGTSSKSEQVQQGLHCNVKSVSWNKEERTSTDIRPEHFTSVWKEPGFSLRTRVNNSQKDMCVSLSDETGLRKFLKLITPLLIECWVESSTVSTFSHRGVDSLITMDSVPLRTSVVIVIQLLCQYIVENHPSEIHWLKKMYFIDYKNHLLKSFPYHVQVPAKKKDKSDSKTIQDSVCHLNIAICDIVTHFLSSPSTAEPWETTVIQYLEDVIRQGIQDKGQMRIVVDILKRLVKEGHNVNLDSSLDVMVQKYTESHPLSTDRKLLFYFFSGLILDRDEQQKLGVDIIDRFMTSLPDLFITIAKSNPQMAAQILEVMKSSACQKCWILLQKLNQFIVQVIESEENLLDHLDLHVQKSIFELVYYIPDLKESSLKLLVKLVRDSNFPLKSCLYLLQILHHRYASVEKSPEKTAEYISFMLSVILGEGMTVKQHCYEVIGEIDSRFLTGSTRWERTLALVEAVSLHLSQHGDTEQMVQIIAAFLCKLQKTKPYLTECQLISVMILSNHMEFYKYPIADCFTDSFVQHFWTFCRNVAEAEKCLSVDSTTQFKLLYNLVLQKMMDSLCWMKNGLQHMVSCLHQDLSDNGRSISELKGVCRSGSLWLHHYDNWLQRSHDPIDIRSDMSKTVVTIQENLAELKQCQWWSDFSFLVSRLKL